jgi:hypothetical protein
VGVLGKYSKFAAAGEKAAVRQSTLSIAPRGQSNTHAKAEIIAPPTEVAPAADADTAPL